MTAGESNKFSAKAEYYSSINSGIDMTQQHSQGHQNHSIRKHAESSLNPDLISFNDVHVEALDALIIILKTNQSCLVSLRLFPCRDRGSM